MRAPEDHEHNDHNIRRAEDDPSCRPASFKRKGFLEPHNLPFMRRALGMERLTRKPCVRRCGRLSAILFVSLAVFACGGVNPPQVGEGVYVFEAGPTVRRGLEQSPALIERVAATASAEDQLALTAWIAYLGSIKYELRLLKDGEFQLRLESSKSLKPTVVGRWESRPGKLELTPARIDPERSLVWAGLATSHETVGSETIRLKVGEATIVLSRLR